MCVSPDIEINQQEVLDEKKAFQTQHHRFALATVVRRKGVGKVRNGASAEEKPSRNGI